MDDKELIACYLAEGRREAVDELIARHMCGVRAVVFQMVRDDSVTDDLTQDVFLKAFRSLASFKGEAAFSTWLFRIAMNTTHTYLGKAKRQETKSLDLHPESQNIVDDTPEQSLLEGELHGEIEKAIGALSPKLRAAIVLTALQEKTPQEAAEIERCNVATMYWRIHEARKKLNHQLANWLQT